jgi:hypothetical protein
MLLVLLFVGLVKEGAGTLPPHLFLLPHARRCCNHLTAAT